MSNDNLPAWFWVTITLALVWNLLGFLAFYGQATITPEILAAMPQPEQDLYNSMPMWVNIAFAVATSCGSLGCIALLMRKALAIVLFKVSLVGIIIQMTHSLFFSDAMAVYGSIALVMPTLVTIIAIALLVFSFKLREQQWIN